MKRGTYISSEALLLRKRKRCNKIRKENISKMTEMERFTAFIFDKTDIKYEAQYPIYTNKSFILVDFYIPEKHLAIEIDGSFHNNRSKSYQSYNKWRERVIGKFGAILLRFTNEGVYKNPETFRDIVLKRMSAL